MEYTCGVMDCITVIKEEINRCRLSNKNGRNDEAIKRLRNVIREITEITGVEYE